MVVRARVLVMVVVVQGLHCISGDWPGRASKVYIRWK